jgi:hypothetical protein
MNEKVAFATVANQPIDGATLAGKQCKKPLRRQHMRKQKQFVKWLFGQKNTSSFTVASNSFSAPILNGVITIETKIHNRNV